MKFRNCKSINQTNFQPVISPNINPMYQNAALNYWSKRCASACATSVVLQLTNVVGNNKWLFRHIYLKHL